MFDTREVIDIIINFVLIFFPDNFFPLYLFYLVYFIHKMKSPFYLMFILSSFSTLRQKQTTTKKTKETKIKIINQKVQLDKYEHMALKFTFFFFLLNWIIEYVV